MNEFEKGFISGMLASKKKSENPYVNYDDNWSYPSYWLQLPEPKENQVIMLIDNKGGTINSEESYTYIPHINIIENTKTTINLKRSNFYVRTFILQLQNFLIHHY